MTNLVRWFTPEEGTNWDTVIIYSSTTETGTFTELERVELPEVLYWDYNGSVTDWYKIAYYDTDSGVTGTQSDAFQGIVSQAVVTRTLYTTPTELRKFLQFSKSDYPNDEDMLQFLDRSHVVLAMDIQGGGSIGSTISDSGKLKLLALLLTGSFVLRSLATRALAKGYTTVSMEGVNIQKAHDALMAMSSAYYDKYQEMLAKDTVDYAFTSFTGDVGTYTVQEIKDIMNGVSDFLDYESEYRPSVNGRSGSGDGS